MSIGTTIKKLRRERDMTQEQLAEYLGISACAVSQWECDRTAPDISQIPLLVRIFGVTSDELLGIGDLNKEAEIKRLHDEIDELSRIGKKLESFELAEKAHKMYPDSYDLMYAYASQFIYVYYNKDFSEDEKKKLLAELIKLLEAIMAGCTDEDLRRRAMSEILWMYRESDQLDKAREVAKKFPRMCDSYELLKVRISEGDELIDAHMSSMYHGLLQILSNTMTHNFKDGSGKRFFTYAERCKLYEKQIKLIELFFDDGDYGSFWDDYREAHRYVAEYYAKQGDGEKALTYLSGAADTAAAYMRDYYQKNYTHTSLLFRGFELSGEEIWYQSTDNDASNLLAEMKNPRYDFIRADERFAAIEEKLAPLAGKWE